MNKKLAVVLTGMLAIVLLLGYGRVTAEATPGDASDPLVTKRYVDDQITALRGMLGQPAAQGMASTDRDELFTEIMVYFESVYGNLLREVAASGTASGPAPAVAAQAQVPYEAVFVEAGRMIIGLSGTEMILRGGSAVAVSGVNGLCNVTIGSDVVNGMEIQMNHLHIVPGSDGRGMRFLTDSYLMIKGAYYFVN
jgi:hypothetical protein